MPNEVVDQQSTPAHPQTFAHKLGQLLLVEVMGKKAAAHQIEGPVAERQSQRVGHDAVISTGKMRSRPIQERHIERDSASRQLLPNHLRNFSRSSRHFQQREVFRPGNLSSAFHHFLRGRDAAEPAIDPPEIPQCSLYISRRAGVRIENLRRVDSLHGKVIQKQHLKRQQEACGPAPSSLSLPVAPGCRRLSRSARTN